MQWILSTLLAVASLLPQTTAPDFSSAAAAVQASIDRDVIRGAVLMVGQGDDVLFHAAFGEGEAGVPMQADAIFDLASLTKGMATAAAIMRLDQSGELDLDAPVSTLIPGLVPADFGGAGTPITVKHLLLHTSGLAPVCPTSDFQSGASDSVADGVRKFAARPLRAVPGESFLYSDLGFILLGKIVESLSGRTLADYCRDEIYAPLGMADTSFGPLDDARLARCLSTEPGTPIGTVHDPRARAMGGVAGHAGLFGTARDVARFCALLATRPENAPLGPSAIESMTRTRFVASPWRDKEKVAAKDAAADFGTARAFGLDVATRFSSPRGSLFPRFRSFGHTGFTGPAYWVDAETGVWYVLMTSRLQLQDPVRSVTSLRRVVADEVARATRVGARPVAPYVMTGVDVLEAEDCASLTGMRVGLITNTTGVTRHGKRTVDVLHESSNVELVRLFSPEHGLYAKLEGRVGDGADPETGLPVLSLYGATRKPTPEMLEGLDAVVFDIQDIGVRFYTYISTLGLAMEACRDAGIVVIVLDRPNPITGTRVAGPRADQGRLSFIAWRPLPITHGMTMGEIAGLFNGEWGGIGAKLSVVKMQGWTRAMWWEETGVPWVNPSPNMRNPTQAVLYPFVGLIEGANVSVGRGTDEPFELFGAPWIDGPALCQALRADGHPGLQFAPIRFTPSASKFAGEICEGVHITVTKRDVLRPVEAGLAVLWHLNDLFGADFNAARGDSRMISAATFAALMAAPDWRRVPSTYADDSTSFLRQRAPYLLYE